MSSSTSPQRPLVAVVNVARTWAEVERQQRTAGQVVLGDWNPYKGSSSTKLAFDPNAVGLVLGHRWGVITEAFDVDAQNPFTWDNSYSPRRIRWNGSQSTKWAHLSGAPSPVTWRQGEGTPIKILTITELAAGTAQVHNDDGGGKRAVLGDATISLLENGVLVVTMPAGRELIVRTTG
jgi:hypothetical protein